MDQDVEFQEELSGIVTAVLYSNVENGYTVLRLRDSDDQQQTVVGCFPYMAPGESIIATGTWVTHATYGKQFKAGYAIRMLPTTTDEIYAYLAGGAVKGIGAATASLIVNTFEGRSLDILENHPEKLAEIRGISLSRAKEFSEFYRQQAGMRHLIDFVCSYGVRPIIAVRLYRFYAEHALETLHTDPYIIASNHIGGTFSEADTMALQLGFATDSLERVRAAIRFELVHNLNNGHCFIPEPDLLQASCRLIEVEEEAAMHGMDDLVESGQIIRENMRGKNICYLPELYEAETYVASRLVSMSRRPVSGSTDVTALIQKKDADDLDLDFSDAFSGMDFTDLLSESDFELDVPEMNFGSMLSGVQVNLSPDNMENLASELVTAYTEYSESDPATSWSELPDSLREYLETDEANAAISEAVSELTQMYMSRVITEDEMRVFAGKILLGYQEFLAEREITDPDEANGLIDEYLASEQGTARRTCTASRSAAFGL